MEKSYKKKEKKEKEKKKMFGYFLLKTEIYMIIQIIILLFFSIILQEKVINLKYKLNILNIVQFFACLILFYSIIILYNSIFYDAILLNYQIICDNLSFFFKFILLLTSLICILFSWSYCDYENIKVFEYIILLLLSVVGMLTIVSSYDLITMYLAIELQSLCFYVVTNLKFYSNFSIEAGLKYFILGALSSGILLFGCSLLYGSTGLTNFLDLKTLFYYYNMSTYNLYYYTCSLIGLIFIYCGILFKIGVVPFHMWVSDIYEGSPTNITFFFAVVPQISIISLLLRLNVIFLDAYMKYLYIFFLCLSILSILVGTFGAIYQTKLKRILAYSSINNIGYVLSGFLTVDIEGMYSVIFYMIVYNIISIGLWILLLNLRNQSNFVKLKEIGDLVLLFKSNKYLSIIFFIFLFSGMGIPPMIGFYSKLFILLNIIELKMYFFALFLIIMNSISVIYYLRLIKIMFSLNTDKSIFIVDIGEITALILLILVYINILFFFFPNYIIIILHNFILLFA